MKIQAFTRSLQSKRISTPLKPSQKTTSLDSARKINFGSELHKNIKEPRIYKLLIDKKRPIDDAYDTFDIAEQTHQGYVEILQGFMTDNINTEHPRYEKFKTVYKDCLNWLGFDLDGNRIECNNGTVKLPSIDRQDKTSIYLLTQESSINTMPQRLLRN